MSLFLHSQLLFIQLLCSSIIPCSTDILLPPNTFHTGHPSYSWSPFQSHTSHVIPIYLFHQSFLIYYFHMPNPPQHSLLYSTTQLSQRQFSCALPHFSFNPYTYSLMLKLMNVFFLSILQVSGTSGESGIGSDVQNSVEQLKKTNAELFKFTLKYIIGEGDQ